MHSVKQKREFWVKMGYSRKSTTLSPTPRTLSSVAWPGPRGGMRAEAVTLAAARRALPSLSLFLRVCGKHGQDFIGGQ